jgi:tRNA(Ile)-lysidine synthase
VEDRPERPEGGPGRPPAVGRVLERVTATVRRHDLIEPGSKVLLAVSGGGDSMCLMHAMHDLQRLLRVRLEVVHVDHARREESAADAAFVERAARKLGLACTVHRVEGRIPRGASPEAWLREQRQRLFAHALHETGSASLATAHTADDQAETVLAAVLRGGGLDSVAGIPAVSSIGFATERVIHPLLGVTRKETHAFCRAVRIRPRTDPMNRDPRYLRAALRHQVIPQIEKSVGRGVAAALARTADALRPDAAYLRELSIRAARDVVQDHDGRDRLLDAVRLRELPGPIASRVVLQALRDMAPAESDPSGGAHVEAVMDLARGRPGRRADLPGGLIAVRERSYVRLSLLPQGPDL